MMIMRPILIIVSLFCFGTTLACNEKQQLIGLFNKAENSYLMDDYQQLYSYINQYYEIMNSNWELLGDSADVYEAYYNKMCGCYYYGFAEGKGLYFDSAEKSYFLSLDVFSKRNSTDKVVAIHKELAQLYYKIGDYTKAYSHLEFVLNHYNKRCFGLGIESEIPDYYMVLSQLAICNARLGRYVSGLSQIDEALKYNKKSKTAEYFEMLRKKAKIIMLQADGTDKANYQEAKRCYEQYVNERCCSIGLQLGMMDESQRGQYWLATHQFLYDCYRLGNHAPELLYNLALFSKGYLIAYENNNKSLQTEWKQVRKELDEKDCAIEFVQYIGKHDEKRLGCLLLCKTSKKPVFIDLLSTDSILSLPLTEFETLGDAIESPFSDIKNDLYNDSRLSNLIWTPQLMNAIGKADKIYFAPDGFIHQLAIEYLMPDTQKVCYRLSSTRNLLNWKKPPKLESALLCGGINYDANYRPVINGNDTIAYRYLSLQMSPLEPLPGSRNEIDSIYKTRNNPKDTILTGEQATDDSFLKALNRHYDVVHLSTHGYYGGKIGVYNDIKPLFFDDSMSKSGIFLAGASNTLSDENFDENLYDGVLSAAELSKQDFSKTELVVLSACQTGNGHLTEDGIYGIQRGLKQAGAHAIIVSLWNVSDYSSSLLMHFFYQELEQQKYKNIHNAFLTARQRLKEEQKVIFLLDESTFLLKKEILHFDDPSHINPFIIIDAY